MTYNQADLILIEARINDALCRVYRGDTLLHQTKIDLGNSDTALVQALSGWISDKTQIISNRSDTQGMNMVPVAAKPEIIQTHVDDPRVEMLHYKGVCQAQPPAILTQGSAQIFGYLAQNPEFDGVLCLVDDHTSWARISAEEIVSFANFATGEVYRTLTRGEFANDAGAAFLAGVEQGYSAPAKFASRLNSIRAGQVLNGVSHAGANAQICGLFIGAEIASARPYWLGMPVVVIGDDAPARAYQSALLAQGVSCETYDAHTARMRGIQIIRDAAAQT